MRIEAIVCYMCKRIAFELTNDTDTFHNLDV